MTIANALTQIASVVSGVSGIKAAPANPAENINEYPFCLIYVMEGTTEISETGTRLHLFNVAIDLLTVRRDISLDMAILTPFLDSIPQALLSEVSSGGDLFQGGIDTWGMLREEFLPFYPYAGVDMIGYRFTMEACKLRVNL